VLIEHQWGAPSVCNDGVTIAREFELEDPQENPGARVLRQAAEKMGESAGDGTTTATVLAHAIFFEGQESIAEEAVAVDLKRGLELGLKSALETVFGVAGILLLTQATMTSPPQAKPTRPGRRSATAFAGACDRPAGLSPGRRGQRLA
jgi:hypothetical protein